VNKGKPQKTTGSAPVADTNVTGAQRNRDWERLERSGRWQQRLLAGNQSELQTGESLDIRSVNLFIGIESREEPRDQN